MRLISGIDYSAPGYGEDTAEIPENPVLAGALQSDLVAVEQMSAADLRRLADSLGRYDVVTVVVSARLAPLAFAARSDA
jgi:ferritin-like metal-binding protein YciE